MLYKRFLNIVCNRCGLSADVHAPKNSIWLRNCQLSTNCNGTYQVVSRSNLRHELYQEPKYSFIKNNKTIKKIETQNLLSGKNTLTISGVYTGYDNGIEQFFVVDKTGNRLLLENKSTCVRNSALFMHLYEITDDFNQYTEFVFNRSGTAQTVIGEDDSNERNLLSFKATDLIEVYVNGTRLAPVDYIASDNMITFTPVLLRQSMNVQVYVYRDIPSLIQNATIIKLKFNGFYPTVANKQTRAEMAWGDTYSIIDESEKFLMYCNNLSDLSIGKTYGVSKLSAWSYKTQTEHEIATDYVELLIADSPYSFVDKDTRTVLPLTVIINGPPLQYTTGYGENVLLIDNQIIENRISPIKISSSNELQSTRVTAVSNITDPDTKYIIGVR